MQQLMEFKRLELTSAAPSDGSLSGQMQISAHLSISAVSIASNYFLIIYLLPPLQR